MVGMDKEEEFQRAQNALNGDDGRSGTIFHEIHDGVKRLVAEEDKRKNEQALLTLAQEFAATKARILKQLPELHNKIDETRKLAQKAISEAEAKAQRDDNDRMVFRDKDGNARYEDGSLVPADEAEKITWRDGATSWEEYNKLRDILERLDQYDQELVTIEDDIHRMGDDATPEKVERLREHEKRMDDIDSNVEQIVSELSAHQNINNEIKVVKTSPASLPDLKV